jgi:hypothetical protein
MNKESKNIDKLFSEKLLGYRETAPVYAWSRLEHDLDKDRSGSFNFWFRWAAASVFILLAFGAGYFYANLQIKKADVVAVEQLKQTNSEIDVSDNNSTDNKTKDISLDNAIKGNKAVTLDKSDNIIVTQNSENPADVDDIQTLVSMDIEFQANDDSESLSINDTLNNSESLVHKTIADKYEVRPLIASDIKSVSLNNEPIENSEYSASGSEYEDILKEKDKKEKFKWSVGAQIAPIYSYRDISLNYENQQQVNSAEAEKELNDSEEALISMAGGIDINYNLSSRWTIQTGMYYSKIGQVNNNALNFVEDDNQYMLYSISTSTGNINIAFGKIPADIRKINPPKDTLESVDLNNVKIIQNFNLFEIPLLIKYKIINRKFGLSISGGLSPAYITKNRTYLQVNSDKYDIGNSGNLNSVIYNSTIGLGMNYSISKNLYLEIQPMFKYSLSPINKGSQFDYHPYSFSWFTGLNYKF